MLLTSPIDIVTNAFAPGINPNSYDGNLDFGITACGRSVPNVQRIINDMEAVLAELEQVAGFPRGKIFRNTEKASLKKT